MYNQLHLECILCGPITVRHKGNVTVSPCSLVVLNCEKYALLRAGRNDAHC